jgi:hypothetical protein
VLNHLLMLRGCFRRYSCHKRNKRL